MNNNYIFQMDINDPSSWLLYYNLRDVFRHADPANPEQTFAAIQDVLDHRDMVDYSEHENSPYRNRPAYLDYPKEHFMDEDEKPQLLKNADPVTRKDWSALGR